MMVLWVLGSWYFTSSVQECGCRTLSSSRCRWWDRSLRAIPNADNRRNRRSARDRTGKNRRAVRAGVEERVIGEARRQLRRRNCRKRPHPARVNFQWLKSKIRAGDCARIERRDQNNPEQLHWLSGFDLMRNWPLVVGTSCQFGGDRLVARCSTPPDQEMGTRSATCSTQFGRRMRRSKAPCWWCDRVREVDHSSRVRFKVVRGSSFLVTE